MYSKKELKTIISGKYKNWIKVPKFSEEDLDWFNYADAYVALLEHHEKETKFLIQTCKKLAKELFYMHSFDDRG